MAFLYKGLCNLQLAAAELSDSLLVVGNGQSAAEDRSNQREEYMKVGDLVARRGVPTENFSFVANDDRLSADRDFLDFAPGQHLLAVAQAHRTDLELREVNDFTRIECLLAAGQHVRKRILFDQLGQALEAFEMAVKSHVIAAYPADGIDQRSLGEVAPRPLTLLPPDRFDLIPEKGIDTITLSTHQPVGKDQHLQAPVAVGPSHHREGAREQDHAQNQQLERLERSATHPTPYQERDRHNDEGQAEKEKQRSEHHLNNERGAACLEGCHRGAQLGHGAGDVVRQLGDLRLFT